MPEAANNGRSVDSCMAIKEEIMILVGTVITVVPFLMVVDDALEVAVEVVEVVVVELDFEFVFVLTTKTPLPAPSIEEARISTFSLMTPCLVNH